VIRAALFDWDGTLADTAEASYRCYVRTFAAFGIAFDREIYASSYSPNWYHTFRTLGLPEHRWPEADEAWLRNFADETVDLIDGARELFETLDERGVAIGIVTSGTRDRVRRELEMPGLAPHVRECVFGSDVAEKKPHPAALQLCIDRLSVEPSTATYIGDSPEDIQMARAAGVLSIAVPGGYPNREALLAAQPDILASSLHDVARIIGERSRPVEGMRPRLSANDGRP